MNYFGDGELRYVHCVFGEFGVKIDFFNKIDILASREFRIFGDPGEPWVHQVIQILSTVCFCFILPNCIQN